MRCCQVSSSVVQIKHATRVKGRVCSSHTCPLPQWFREPYERGTECLISSQRLSSLLSSTPDTSAYLSPFPNFCIIIPFLLKYSLRPQQSLQHLWQKQQYSSSRIQLIIQSDRWQNIRTGCVHVIRPHVHSERDRSLDLLDLTSFLYPSFTIK